MSWNFAYTPQIWQSVFTTLLFIILIVFTQRRLSVPGALPFMIACMFAAAWAAGSVMEYAAKDLTTKIFLVKFQAACQLPAATAVTCFVLEYSWPGRWLTRRNLALLSIAPLLVLGLIITDPLHHLMWSSFQLDESLVTPQVNLVGWMTIIYSFGLVILNFVVFTWLFLHSPNTAGPLRSWFRALLGSVRSMCSRRLPSSAQPCPWMCSD